MEDAGMSAFFSCKLKEGLSFFICLYHFSQSLVHQHGI